LYLLVADVLTMTAAVVDFNASLTRSMSESRTRFAVTGSNVRELSMTFSKNRTQQAENAAKLRKRHSSMTPAASKPCSDKVV